MVHTYSLQRDGRKRLTPHFRVREFAAPGTDEIKIDSRLVDLLEKLFIRLRCSKIVITCGYRVDGSGSQHTRGCAADVNCWHWVRGRQVRYQGREILLAAEEVGFDGIGWIPGSAKSRAAVHLDTRGWRYYFDEANYNRSIGSSWFTFFGLPNPQAPHGNPHPYPHRVLRRWCRGGDVKWVQWHCQRLGQQVGRVDGIYGGQTRSAVMAVQRSAGIAVDGIVGPATRKVLSK